MVEQIRIDTRLNDGESETLYRVSQSKGLIKAEKDAKEQKLQDKNDEF